MKIKKKESSAAAMILAGILLLVSACAMPLEESTSTTYETYQVPGPSESKVSSLVKLKQFAVRARASSQYGSSKWSAFQATGEPNTLQCGDIPTAWASKSPDREMEWIEVDYAQPVWVEEITIYETLNPGAVARVEAKKSEGVYTTLWEGYDPTRVCPGTLKITVQNPVMAGTIRVTLNSGAVSGWNEIDAIEMVGEGSSSGGTELKQNSEPRIRRK